VVGAIETCPKNQISFWQDNKGSELVGKSFFHGNFKKADREFLPALFN